MRYPIVLMIGALTFPLGHGPIAGAETETPLRVAETFDWDNPPESAERLRKMKRALAEREGRGERSAGGDRDAPSQRGQKREDSLVSRAEKREAIVERFSEAIMEEFRARLRKELASTDR